MPHSEFSSLASSLPGVAAALLLLGVSSCGSPGPRREAATASDSTAAAEAAWATVQAVNRAWAVERSLDSLRPHFHPNFVGIYPNSGERTEGREGVLASYGQFFSSATVNRYREERPEVQVYGGGRFAVVTYVYDMEYVEGGRTIATAGQDMYALVNEGGRWLVVAQQFQPLPGRPM